MQLNTVTVGIYKVNDITIAPQTFIDTNADGVTPSVILALGINW